MAKKRSRAPWQLPPKKRRRGTSVAKAIHGPTGAVPAAVPEALQLGDRASLARLAENVWRLGCRARREESGNWAQSMIERLNDDLRDLGIEIIDRTGTPYRDGETIERLHSDAPADWTGGLVVTEVICPTIRVGGLIVEHGKVVVGPDTDNTREVNDNAG